MQMDSLAAVDMEKKVVAKEPVVVQAAAPVKESVKTSESGKDTEKKSEQGDNPYGKDREPAKSSMDAAMTLLNYKIARTHCA